VSRAAGVRVRPGREEDLPGIDALYAPYVRETAITFDVEPPSPEARAAWWRGFAPRGPHRLLVGEEADRVVGYACSRPFRPKAAYAASVETSVYLARGEEGRGIGTRLYAALFEALAHEDVHVALAGVALPNPASLALHHRFGFASLGVFPEVGRKLGRYWDVEWLARRLP